MNSSLSWQTHKMHFKTVKNEVTPLEVRAMHTGGRTLSSDGKYDTMVKPSYTFTGLWNLICSAVEQTGYEKIT